MNPKARSPVSTGTRRFVLLALATILVGCANRSPLPPGVSQYQPPSWPVNNGHPSRWDDRVFLREPTTTWADVIKMYGPPDGSFLDGRVIVYSWDALWKKAYWRWETDIYRRIAFFIAFKPAGAISHYGSRWVDPQLSLEQNVDRWVPIRRRPMSCGLRRRAG